MDRNESIWCYRQSGRRVLKIFVFDLGDDSMSHACLQFHGGPHN